MSQAGLPEFSKPPVQEVVLSAKFKPTGLTVGHVGLLWAKFRETFPNVEEHAPLDVPIEKAEERVASNTSARLQLLSRPHIRTWFVDETGAELIQIQHDFFAHNWRRRESVPEYPRYESIRERFSSELDEFSAFLRDEKLGNPEAVQCEVTYVNHIVADEGWSDHPELEKVFRVWASPQWEFLPMLEDGRFVARFAIPGTDGSFGGRLNVSVQPGFTGERATERKILITTLTARGAPLTSDAKGVMGFLDLGHEWIVRGFADITTEAMHRAWGRTR